MKYQFLLLCTLFVFAFVILSQPSQVTAAQTASADQDNPIKPTPDSLAKAKRLFGYDCAMCHGGTGDGKGDLASDFKTKPRDYTDPAALKDFTDAQLFTIIKDGKGDMPPEGKRAKSDDIWGLVNYIRSLSKQ